MNLIFFDIDGTLLPEGETVIGQDVIEAIESVKSDDTEVFICTGRCYQQAKPFLEQLNLQSYITSNGQEVCYKNKILYESKFTNDQKNEIINLAAEFDLSLGFETRKSINLVSNKNIELIKSIIEEYGFLDVVISNDFTQDIYQFWFFGDTNNIIKASKQLHEKYSFYNWNEQSLEILPLNESKGRGIKIVVEEFDEVKTFAFGDGINDYEMFQYVDTSVAMGNAVDKIKQISSFVTTDCKDDGIINGLKYIGLRK